MLKKDLAQALGISASMVSRLAAQGMPTDSIATAKRWRETHLSAARRKEYRAPSISRPRKAVDLDMAEPASDAPDWHDLADLFRMGLALLGTSQFALIEPRLRKALREVPIAYRQCILLGAEAASDPPTLPLPVVEVLIADFVAAVRAIESEMEAAGELPPMAQRDRMSDEEADDAAAYLYAAAAGEVVVSKVNSARVAAPAA